MIDNKNIVWIASYPKSGNTWMRSILTGLIYSEDGKFDFNLLKKIDQFEKDENFKFVKNISSSDYINLNKLDFISKYWEKSQLNVNKNETVFFKTHSANYKHGNLRFTNLNRTKGAIYLVRDPRDVAISYSKFIGKNIDETIEYMIDSRRQIWNHKKTLGIILSRWDYHLASWLNSEFPTMIIKYEDLLEKNEEKVLELIDFLKQNLKLDFNTSEKKLQNIIKSTSFVSLKEKESVHGFKEASKNSNFFRSGKSQQWKKELNKNQISLIEKNFENYMKKFNYID